MLQGTLDAATPYAGAQRAHRLLPTARMVVVQGLSLALAGLVIGVTAALVLTRLLSSFSHLLYGVGASDPATLVSVSAVLIGVAILASYLPARRAMRVDPMVALRYE